jgi:hypothetical protein
VSVTISHWKKRQTFLNAFASWFRKITKSSGWKATTKSSTSCLIDTRRPGPLLIGFAVISDMWGLVIRTCVISLKKRPRKRSPASVWGQTSATPAMRERHVRDPCRIAWLWGGPRPIRPGLRVGEDPVQLCYSRSTVTGASPEKPSAFAPAGVTSIMRPRTKGPRSLTVTTTDRPLLRLVTRTLDPNGRDR